ncbi:MAG: hypothetical protein ACLP01_08040 [Solirubrobacteraceae bacterium]
MIDNPSALRYYARFVNPLLALGRNATAAAVVATLKSETGTSNPMMCDSYQLAQNQFGWNFAASPVGEATGIPGACGGSAAATAGNAGQLFDALGMTRCDPVVYVNPQTTSCPFGQNVYEAYVSTLRHDPAKLPQSVTASGPAIGQTYTVSCVLDGDGGLTCSDAKGAQVSFTFLAADAASVSTVASTVTASLASTATASLASTTSSTSPTLTTTSSTSPLTTTSSVTSSPLPPTAPYWTATYCEDGSCRTFHCPPTDPSDDWICVPTCEVVAYTVVKGVIANGQDDCDSTDTGEFAALWYIDQGSQSCATDLGNAIAPVEVADARLVPSDAYLAEPVCALVAPGSGTAPAWPAVAYALSTESAVAPRATVSSYP